MFDDNDIDWLFNYTYILEKCSRLSFNKTWIKVSHDKQGPYCPHPDFGNVLALVVMVQDCANFAQLERKIWFSWGILLPLTAANIAIWGYNRKIRLAIVEFIRMDESTVYYFKFIVHVNHDQIWESWLMSPVTAVGQQLGTTLIRCQLFGRRH